MTYLPSFNHVKGIDIPINKIPAIKPPRILDELDEDELESESELSESDPPLLLDPPSKSSTSDNDDSASTSI